MTPQLASPSWYRVAQLRPRLRSHARIHRHEYRGVRWHILEDRLSRRSHRLNAGSFYVVGLMDGRRTMQQIWDAALARFGDETPTQDEVIRLFAQLHMADILQCELAPDLDELLRRAQRLSRRGFIAKLMSPLALKVPLVDPDRALERFLPWYQGLFGRAGALVWLAVMGWATLATLQHWDELTMDLSNRVLAPENLLIIGLVFPLVKAIHELGHACAVKVWGGEVHEMGIMFLVLMPVPYVDASAANAFPEKRRRVIVGGAGMAVELFIAAVALFFWLEMEPGVLRAVLFNVILIAGVSTVLFNVNPLLRFDGYYMLSDYIEIPNLRQRAQQVLSSFFERRLFGVQSEPPEATASERAWLVFFAIASSIYRVTITLGIALFLATQYFLLGVLLAIWTLVTGIVLPLVKLVYFISMSPRLRRHRLRAALSTGSLALILGLLLFVVPVPSWTNAQGVLWGADQWVVRGAADGFVVKVLAEPGSHVRRGMPLVETSDPLLAPRIRVLEAEHEAAEARYQAVRIESLVAAQGALERLKIVDAELQRARERARDLLVQSPSDGVFALPAPEDLPGRYLKQGEQIGYVLPEGTLRARVVVPQASVDLVRSQTMQVSVRIAERVGETIPARILREVPRASDRLPSAALSQAGGGDLALDPAAPGAAARTMDTHFEFEIELLTRKPAGAGGRVYVRFDHRAETIAQQVWRLTQQLFLRLFAV